MINNEVQILLVEDNSSDAELTIRALTKNNLANKLVHLKDGAEALDYIFTEGSYSGRDMDNQPNLILLDLKMPKINGIEVLRRIKSDDRTRNISVVMLTSSHENQDIKECFNLGVNSYVVKPVEFDQFTKAVSDIGLYWMILNQSSK